MAHPTHEIRDLKRRMDALEAENAALRGRMPPEPEEPAGPEGLPPGGHVLFDNSVVNGHGDRIGHVAEGQFVPAVAMPTVEELGAKAAAEHAAVYEAQHRRMTAGLPKGLYRDPAGLIRKDDGTYAPQDWRKDQTPAMLAEEEAMKAEIRASRRRLPPA